MPKISFCEKGMVNEMEKYKIGDYVLYGVSGACKITEIGTLSFGGPDKIYYSLKPVYDSRSTIYVPVMKEDEIVRKVMSREEAKEIVEKLGEVTPAETMPEKETCDAVLKSGDHVEVIKMILLLRNLRKENRKNHKGLNISEERMLRDAERIFFSEMATAFDMSMEEVVQNLSISLDRE